MREINKTNKRRKSGGNYLNQTELMDILQQGYQIALKKAALETYEGRYEPEELAAMVNKAEIFTQAVELMQK
ncbi:hypothetical protein [Nodularia sphaerocarpa]|uniref:hypothetical protein n=1 Tax=Nodularia sphaerocarpa TaxID=137816 RepID=UPI001EFB3427|nr:hypothetical protein [Nodularia sphaerocarpa]MDB9372223.1 hypothetical protein [Nodularia sphaerocarpa CS-585]MDB9377816.1 hypothetical protein [Nodularia sphaerocarpa CS-585A2]ULP74609.1 hypothetical protein BDGGKGIB_04278 [Nodularia sphaerocarpa UHCC 0038]